MNLERQLIKMFLDTIGVALLLQTSLVHYILVIALQECQAPHELTDIAFGVLRIEKQVKSFASKL